MEKNLIILTTLVTFVVILLVIAGGNGNKDSHKKSPKFPKNPNDTHAVGGREPSRNNTEGIIVTEDNLDLSQDVEVELDIRNSSSGAPNNGTVTIRVIGGSDTGMNEFPWQVSIQIKEGGPICGGAIITPNKVLTASHCVFGEETARLLVIAGVHNIFNPDGTEQRVNVTEAEHHFEFMLDNFNNDMAILTLETDLIYGDKVAPIRLANPGVKASGICINTGWGNIRNDGTGDEYPEKLQKIFLEIIDHESCKAAYENVNTVTENMICAGDAQGNKGSCNGDSGGPLVCNDDNGTFLAGVVSWGVFPCALYPSVFASVEYFLDWINERL